VRAEAKKPDVGGQAVIEGVMMRSPNSYVVVCRLQDGRIAVRESPWRSVWDRLGFLRRPFLRGAVVLFESLHNGLDALSFAANQQVESEAAAAGEEAPEMNSGAVAGTLIVSMVMAFAIFGALPHLLAFLAGEGLGVDIKDGTSVAFHAIDGLIKAALFLTYLWGISRLEDIRRVFMYHGAEHKSIATYEAGEELIVANARQHSRFHPRCGTSFIFMVILTSMLVFSVVFPMIPKLVESTILNQVLYVFIKIPLMFPIAGLAYELQRLSAKAPNNPIVKVLIWPGLALQRITTVEPDDDMLEVALLSLRKVLWREAAGAEAAVDKAGEVEYFDSFEAAASHAALPAAA
jgi:uncharacterized protein YqhQ